VATGRLKAQGRASGAEVESPISWLVEFRDGRVIRMTDFLDPKEALETAGLRGWALSLSGPVGSRRWARVSVDRD
jgi:hypothetical protein